MLSLKAKTILIIDDAPDVRLLARKILEGDFANVFDCANAEDGLKIARKILPHLIITDLIMPDKDGFFFLFQKNKDPVLKNIPAIVMSGQKDMPSVQRAIALTAVDYITKPFKTSLMIQKVKKALKNSAFKSRKFSTKPRPKISIVIDGTLLMANESGLIVQTKVRLGTDAEIEIKAPIIEEMGCATTPMKTVPTPMRLTEPGSYQTVISMIGLESPKIKALRELLRSW
ncbi:response regulator [Bdellovibrionota bacterium FG-2]